MAETALLPSLGAQAQKPTKWATIFTSRFNIGLYTNRNPLRSPLSAFYAEGWKLGSTDALLFGVNVELSSRLTYCRRPGNLQWSTQVSTHVPTSFYGFKETPTPGNPITTRVIVDTLQDISYFTTTTKTTILAAKGAGAGQAYFQGVSETLYFGDGVEQLKWQDFGTGVPGNNNGNLTNPTWLLGTQAPPASINVANGPPVGGHSFIFTAGYGYCYAYKARTANDPYVGGIPPGGTVPLGTPTGSASGLVSTASVTAFSAVGTGVAGTNTITGFGSADPQIDTISIFRTADGGSTYFWLTDILNPGATGWSYVDYQPDSVLNILVIAPRAAIGDPPPVGLVNLTYSTGRLWGSVGNVVFASAGPAVNSPGLPPGNGRDGWPPGQYFTFSAQVVKLIPVTAGILVLTTSRLEIIVGGQTGWASFYSVPLIDGMGFTTYNSATVGGSVVYGFTTDGQCISIDPSAGVTEIGLPVGDTIVTINPQSAYLAFHVSGSRDKALFLGNGGTGWYRCNPNMAPDGAITGPVWSPLANISAGAKALASVEVTPGVHQLLIGGNDPGSIIMNRDSNYNTFTDAGQAYGSSFIMGSIILANPGSMAALRFLSTQFKGIGSQPKVSVLLDELCDISGGGPFEPLIKFESEPPRLSPSTTIYSNRYYFKQGVNDSDPVPCYCLNMQVKIDYGATDIVQNELLSLSINGAILTE